MSERYVGTREAARLLGVSEASIRRWSDAGLLAAHRVGPRRERRFAASDVSRLKAAGRSELHRSSAATVVLEGVAIPMHSHLSSSYTSEAGRLRLGVPFLRDGLLAGHWCVVYMRDETADVFKRELQAEGVDVELAVASGRLQHLHSSTNPDEGIAAFERTFAAITRRGGLAIRLLGEAVENRESMGEWSVHLGFEDRITPLTRRFPVVVLCQYDARRLDGVELVTILKAHGDNFDQPLGMFLN